MGLTESMALALACRWLTDTGALWDPGMKAEATDVSARRRSTNILLQSTYCIKKTMRICIDVDV